MRSGSRIEWAVVLRCLVGRAAVWLRARRAVSKVEKGRRGRDFVAQVPGIARASLRPFLAIGACALTIAMLASPALAAAAETAAVKPVYVFGIPVDFILFGLTLLGVAVFHHYTLQVALTGLGGHHGLQAHFHRLQVRRRPYRLRAAHAARMGDPRQPVPAADGLCAALAAFREEPDARRDAGLPAGRLEGRRRAAGDRVRAVRASSTTLPRR